jgi:hypothetical protein
VLQLARSRMRSAFLRWLSRPSAPIASVALALLLASPALPSGLAGDDYFHQLVLTRNHEISTVPDDPMEMFVWGNGDPGHIHTMMEIGLTGWWTNPTFKMAYFRPLAVLTHWLDYRLWPGAPWLMHLHSLLWFGAALLLLAQLYRRLLSRSAAALHSQAWLPALALLLYAIDDAHAMTLGWIANRNAILAFALGVPVLILHDRYVHDGERRAGVVAPFVLALALLAGESALAVAGYLFAYALFIDRAPRTRSLLRLWPYGAVLALWSTFYRMAGFGAHGSGLVIDPGGEPLRFLVTALERAPVMLAAQVAFPPSDAWEAYPLIAAWLQPVMFGWVWLVVIAFALAIRPLLRAEPTVRFFALGSVLAALPVSAQFPHDRLLLFVGLGAAPLVAMLIGRILQPGAQPEPRLSRVAGYTCIGLHLVLAPLLLPLRVLAPLHGEIMVGHGDRSLDERPSVRDKTIVLINPPLDAYAAYVPPTRAAQGRNRPRALRWLATAGSDVRVTRLDERTLRVRPSGGFLALPSERMQRDPKDRMPVGYRVRFSDLTIEVTALTADGRPAEILAHFDHALEDPSYEFYAWQGLRYEPLALPRIGEQRVFPRVDFTQLLR